jgi:hypothetical protein
MKAVKTKYFNSIFESPDSIPDNLTYTKNGDPVFNDYDEFNLKVRFDDNDALPFWIENGELILGQPGSEHPHKTKKDPESYSGRLWLDWKIISFWHYPNVTLFKRILNELSELLEERYNETFDIYNDDRWEIEVIPDNNWISDKEYQSKLINPKLYTGTGYHRTNAELNQEHIKSPLLKQKKYLKGWGSSNPRYRANRIWQMAAPIGENLNSFVRNQDPIKSLNLGYEGKIRDFFRQYDINDGYYEVEEDGEIVFCTNLDLSNTQISELPTNLTINKGLYLSNTQVSELPANLTVIGDLYLRNTNIVELPNDLSIKGNIVISESQIELINFIKQSKFKNQLNIWGF